MQKQSVYNIKSIVFRNGTMNKTLQDYVEELKLYCIHDSIKILLLQLQGDVLGLTIFALQYCITNQG